MTPGDTASKTNKTTRDPPPYRTLGEGCTPTARSMRRLFHSKPSDPDTDHPGYDGKGSLIFFGVGSAKLKRTKAAIDVYRLLAKRFF